RCLRRGTLPRRIGRTVRHRARGLFLQPRGLVRERSVATRKRLRTGRTYGQRKPPTGPGSPAAATVARCGANAGRVFERGARRLAEERAHAECDLSPPPCESRSGEVAVRSTRSLAQRRRSLPAD